MKPETSHQNIMCCLSVYNSNHPLGGSLTKKVIGGELCKSTIKGVGIRFSHLGASQAPNFGY